MSDKIKFIVDDLADYTGNLLKYSDYILYLPKRIQVYEEEIETQPEYSLELTTKFNANVPMKPLLMPEERYIEILEGFLTEDTESKFIYVKPYTFGLFEEDLIALNRIIDVLNEKYDHRIKLFKSKHFGSALNLIISKLLEKYITEEETTLFELKTLFTTMDDSIYSYVGFYREQSVANFELLTPEISEKGTFLFKEQNKNVEYIETKGEGEISEIYINTISDLLNSLENDYDIMLSTYPVIAYTIRDEESFLNKLNRKKASTVYLKSQSNFVLTNNADVLSVYINNV